MQTEQGCCILGYRTWYQVLRRHDLIRSNCHSPNPLGYIYPDYPLNQPTDRFGLRPSRVSNLVQYLVQSWYCNNCKKYSLSSHKLATEKKTEGHVIVRSTTFKLQAEKTNFLYVRCIEYVYKYIVYEYIYKIELME